MILRVPGAPMSNPNDKARPLYNHPLGIFNLLEQPVMVKQHHFTCRPGKGNPHKTGYRGPTVICSDKVDYFFEGPLHVVINPVLTDADVEVQAGLIFANQAVTYYSPSAFRWLKLHEFLHDGETSQYGRLEMGLQVTVTPHNGSYPDPIVLTNTYDIAQTSIIE
jgi:hypothetical protein